MKELTLKAPIHFKNARPLYHGPNLDDLQEMVESPEAEEGIKDLKLQGVEEVVIAMGDEGAGLWEEREELSRRLKAWGFGVTLLPLLSHDSGEADFSESADLNTGILKGLKKRCYLIVYKNEERDRGRLTVAALLLTLRNKKIDPLTAYKLASRNPSLMEAPKLLSSYLGSLPERGAGESAGKRVQAPSPPPQSAPKEELPREQPGREEPEQKEEKVRREGEEKKVQEILQAPLEPQEREVALHSEEQKREQNRIQQEFQSTKKRFHEDLVHHPSPFTPSRFTIRIKLSTIITAIVAISLGTMILWASALFKGHSTTLIQEYNLSLARLVGSRVEEELEDTSRRARLFYFATEDRFIPASRASSYAELFFKNNPSLIYIGVIRKNGNSIETVRSFFNPAYSEKDGVSKQRIAELNTEYGSNFTASFLGETAVENVSPGFSKPIMGLGIPISERGGEEAILLYMDSSHIMNSFRASRQADIFQILMVNDRGYVVAHSDDKETLSKTNRLELPIVQTMVKGNSDNGSKRYEYKGTEYLGSYQILNTLNLGVISTVETSKVFEAVYRIQKRNILILLTVLTLAFLVVYFFSRSITIPIIRLLGATRQIENGNFHVEITPSARDEVGSLTNSFRNMARGLEERELIKDTFGKFVNPEIAEKALTGDIKLGGQIRECSVIFSDLRNFTGMSEHRDPEWVLDMLNGYFTEMVECIYLTDGIVDKFIGDAIMAHWGAISSTENDAKSAVDSALLMRKALIELNRQNSSGDIPFLRFGCGINTGPVIAGQIGSMKKLEYTVIGDTVNLASRIEYLNKLFGTDILISSRTWEKVKEFYNIVPMEPIKIKGKSNTETVYAVLGWKNDPETPADLDELRRMVGIKFDTEQVAEVIRSSSDSLIKEEKANDENK